MQYLFRDVPYKGKIVRFIKYPDIDSDGFDIAPVDELNAARKYIEQTEPNTRVIIMLGHSSTAVNTDAFMSDFLNIYHRMYDDYYEWNSALFSK